MQAVDHKRWFTKPTGPCNTAHADTFGKTGTHTHTSHFCVRAGGESSNQTALDLCQQKSKNAYGISRIILKNSDEVRNCTANSESSILKLIIPSGSLGTKGS